MEELLITPAQVLEIAFSSTEQLREDLISESVIMVAQIKYIKPRLWELYDELGDPVHSEFINKYIKQPLAHYVRSVVVEDLAVNLSNMGAMQFKNDMGASANSASLERIKRKSRKNADILIGRAIEYLNANPESYPMYQRSRRLQTRLSIKGGVVL